MRQQTHVLTTYASPGPVLQGAVVWGGSSLSHHTFWQPSYAWRWNHIYIIYQSQCTQETSATYSWDNQQLLYYVHCISDYASSDVDTVSLPGISRYFSDRNCRDVQCPFARTATNNVEYSGHQGQVTLVILYLLDPNYYDFVFRTSFYLF